MRMLLTAENKRGIRDAYRDNVTFQSVRAAYKPLETGMRTLGFSPEEIWANSMAIFDRMLQTDADKVGDMAQGLWDDLYCDLRDEAHCVGRAFGDDELACATSCVVYVVVCYMTASGDYSLMRHARTLTMQIDSHTGLAAIEQPMMESIRDGFGRYIGEYIRGRKRISSTFGSPQEYADPVRPLLKGKDRLEVKARVRKRLAFMDGMLPDGSARIMAGGDFDRMMEAVDYLIENNVVRRQDKKIKTNLPVAHLRYTFYLVFKNEGKPIGRQLWLDFLAENFAQMQSNRSSLGKHFADCPEGYRYR